MRDRRVHLLSWNYRLGSVFIRIRWKKNHPMTRNFKSMKALQNGTTTTSVKKERNRRNVLLRKFTCSNLDSSWTSLANTKLFHVFHSAIGVFSNIIHTLIVSSKNQCWQYIAEWQSSGNVSRRYACSHSAYLRGISYTSVGDGLMIDYTENNANVHIYKWNILEPYYELKLYSVKLMALHMLKYYLLTTLGSLISRTNLMRRVGRIVVAKFLETAHRFHFCFFMFLVFTYVHRNRNF